MTAAFLDGYLPYVLRQTDQTLSAPFYAMLTRYGVARSEWRVLAVLHEMGELGVVELAAAALSPQPTVTHAVRRLEERGLVTRKPGVQDKRQRIVSTTDTGAELTEALMREAKQLEAELLRDVGDVTELMNQLRALTAAVDERIRQQATEPIEEAQ